MHTADTDGTPIVRARHHSLLLIVLLSLGGICVGPPSSRSDTLVLFDFTANVLSSDTDPNSTASFVRWNVDGRGISTNEGNPAPSAGNYTTYSNLGDARTNDQVFQFTLAPHSGYTISLSSVSFDIAAEKSPASSTDQTGFVFIYTSRDSESTPVAAGFATDNTADFNPSAFGNWSSTNLSGNALYQNVAAPITFSLYVYGSHPEHLVYFDNIRVEGVAARSRSHRASRCWRSAPSSPRAMQRGRATSDRRSRPIGRGRLRNQPPSPAKDGAGLGLAIAKQIVDVHGATVLADSTLRAGAKFTFAIRVTQTRDTWILLSKPKLASELRLLGVVLEAIEPRTTFAGLLNGVTDSIAANLV